MATGYPSRERARRAFWRGVRAGVSGQTYNPYRNDRLADLWARGKQAAAANPAIVVPRKYMPKAAQDKPPVNRPKPPRGSSRQPARGVWGRPSPGSDRHL